MKLIISPKQEELENILSRPVMELKNIKKIVKPILKKVKKKGDAALYKYALEYDHVELDSLTVSTDEIKNSIESLDNELKDAIQLAKDNIEKFHALQQQEELIVETMPGVTCRRKSVPISNIGLYIPGGSAPLFSTVLMLGVPAKLAGCPNIVLCTPPKKDGKIPDAIVYAAKLIGIDHIIKAGGAQAIAALAYGTETVPKVYKIFGPGNQFVTAAKQIVAEKGVAIDLPAGPSEVAIFADESAIPSFVAADLLSQAEHGADSQVLLVTTNHFVAQKVLKEIEIQLEDLPRKRIATEALENSVAMVVDNEDHAIKILNRYAAEHLILSVKNAEKVAEKIINAGSVFLGNYAPESAGDYASGTNHTLPTNRAALAFSGVSLDSFVKKITYQKITEQGIKNLGPAVEKMAEAEKLTAHKNAVTLRLEYLKKNGLE